MKVKNARSMYYQVHCSHVRTSDNAMFPAFSEHQSLFVFTKRVRLELYIHVCTVHTYKTPPWVKFVGHECPKSLQSGSWSMEKPTVLSGVPLEAKPCSVQLTHTSPFYITSLIPHKCFKSLKALRRTKLLDLALQRECAEKLPFHSVICYFQQTTAGENYLCKTNHADVN